MRFYAHSSSMPRTKQRSIRWAKPRPPCRYAGRVPTQPDASSPTRSGTTTTGAEKSLTMTAAGGCPTTASAENLYVWCRVCHSLCNLESNIILCSLNTAVAAKKWEDKDQTTTKYLSWKQSHVWSINFMGSAGAMEPFGTLALFQRSVGHNLRYKYLVSDGDTKMFLLLSQEQVYGPNP